MLRRIMLIAAVLVAMIGAASAQQSGGQLCVRSFEDRNANGRLDPGEPLLTRGVSANLLDAGGITIASALLDEAPTAAQGVICFQFLAAGQYTVVITSADYTATTPETVIATISEGGLPSVVEFGGQRAAAPTPTGASSSAAAPESERDQLIRIFISALGTAVVVAGMAFVGILVYLYAFRQRKPPAVEEPDPRRTTGSIAAVRTRDTAETPKV